MFKKSIVFVVLICASLGATKEVVAMSNSIPHEGHVLIHLGSTNINDEGVCRIPPDADLAFTTPMDAISVGKVLELVKSQLTSLIDEALERFDYTAANVFRQSLDLVNAWEKANLNIVEKAASKVEDLAFKSIMNLKVLTESAGGDFAELLEQINDMQLSFQSNVQNTLLGQNNCGITGYAPHRISASEIGARVVLRGVNLDIAELQVFEGDSMLQHVTHDPTKFSFEVHDLSPGIRVFRVRHRVRDGRKFLLFRNYRTVEREVRVEIITSIAGHATIRGIEQTEKLEREVVTVSVPQFRAKNTTQHKMASPPSGFFWDLRSGVSDQKNFKVVATGKGKAASCKEVVWAQSSPNGLTISARLDERREFPNCPSCDGYITCGVRGPVYRFVPQEVSFTESLDLEWGGSYSLQLPKGTVESLVIDIVKHDGKVISISVPGGSVDGVFEATLAPGNMLHIQVGNLD